MDYKVIAVRATGVMAPAVATEVESELQTAGKDGWDLHMIQPVIYNSATTGYLLLVLKRSDG